MVGPDGGGLSYCLGFKAFHGLTNTALGCQSIWLGGVPTAMRPNYICFQVTFIEHFIAHWDSIFALWVPPSQVFPIACPCSWDCKLLPYNQWLIQHYECLVPPLGLAWISALYTKSEGTRKYLGFRFCSECGLIRKFKDRGIDSLSHFQFPKNLLYLLYRFLGFHMFTNFSLIGPSFPWKLDYFNV